MKTRTFLLSLSVCVYGLFLLTGCKKPVDDESSTEGRVRDVTEETTITELSFRLKWLIYSSFAPHFVALEEGYYKNNYLDVDIQPGGPGLDPIKLVASGTDLVGLASYDQILAAREKEIPVVAIGEDTTKSGVGFLSLRGSGITEPKDFLGRKVGVMPGTDKGTMYAALMNKLDIDRSKIEEIPIGFNLTLLFQGTIEVFPAFITNQPIVARNKGFEVNVIDPYKYGIRPGGNVYFTSEKNLRQKRAILKRFLKAELKAIIYSQDMPDAEVVEMVMKHNPKLNKQTEIEIWRATKDMLLQSDPKQVGYMREETWKHTADLAFKYGLIDTKPELNSCYTNELIEEIHAENTFH